MHNITLTIDKNGVFTPADDISDDKIKTCLSYMNNEFRLDELSNNYEHFGKKYNELDGLHQSYIDDLIFRITLIDTYGVNPTPTEIDDIKLIHLFKN